MEGADYEKGIFELGPAVILFETTLQLKLMELKMSNFINLDINLVPDRHHNKVFRENLACTKASCHIIFLVLRAFLKKQLFITNNSQIKNIYNKLNISSYLNDATNKNFCSKF